MDGETDKSASDIDAATRLAAMTKQVTIDPLHTDVVADELPDEVIVRQHVNEGALGNLSIDTEATARTQPSSVGYAQPQRSKSQIALFISIAGMIIVSGIVAFAMTH